MATEKIECQAVVIASRAYGESDRIIRLYTERKGKISVIVKGAKSKRSKHLALSEVFTFGLYRLSPGKSFYYLNSGKILEANLSMRESYDRLIYASAVVEIVDRSSFEGEGTQKVFSLIRKTLHELAISEKPLVIFLGFLLKYNAFMGYRPLIPLNPTGDFVFSKDRGVVEDNGDTHGQSLEEADIYTFNHLLYTPLDKINLEEISSKTLEKAYQLLVAYTMASLDIDKVQSLQLRM